MGNAIPNVGCPCGGRPDGTHEFWCAQRSDVSGAGPRGDADGGVLPGVGPEAQAPGAPRRRWTAAPEESSESVARWREEQLDWLCAQQAEAARQTALLERISRHTALLYGIAIAWLVLFGLAVLVVVISVLSGTAARGY